LAALFRLVAVVAAIGLLLWYWAPALPGVETAGATLSLAIPPAATPTLEPSPTPTAPPTGAAYCPPGVQPAFALGFADLKQALGDTMGQPVECEHQNPDNGDSLQKTTTGLAVYEKRTGTLQFTDGWHHWALGPQGVRQWAGESEASGRPLVSIS
jgi:hypothetical protein